MDVQEATRTYTCVFPNCTNDAKSSRGAYSYCDDHRGKTPPERASNGATGDLSTEQKVRSLANLARDVDRAFAKADKLDAGAREQRQAAQKKKREFEKQAAALLGDS